MRKLIIILILSLPSMGALAGDIPKILSAGFEAYESGGPKSAIESWIKGSALEGSKDALAQANMFRQIEDYYGKYLGYDLFKSNNLGPKSNLYLITMNYEKGILFAKFFTYKPIDKNDILVNFKFHTETDMVWPSYMVYGQ
ncbi:hypothetical protein [Lacimicrobium alkaliphilum]|uniref:DUF3887 domain-containing protein n=1 Tax=Lacimicrobium alkaliphilum TaxID=1526571 RepID=A0A0U3ACG9_9ALTE|nr:hypothetical protein [Lacimicrobium alkaliphilum]ALS98734.1 hypothetical protein AT746_10940 [Lacimicrobium alkaliphilum]